MKSTFGKLALGAVYLTSSVTGLISMQVRYTDNMINGMWQFSPSKYLCNITTCTDITFLVGNLDAFTATWTTLYAADGNL